LSTSENEDDITVSHMIATRCYASAAYAIMWCLSVCPSDCPSDCLSHSLIL